LPGIIAGSHDGCIKTFSHIFIELPYESISGHSGEVSKIVASPDGQYVISAGQDGAILVFQVT